MKTLFLSALSMLALSAVACSSSTEGTGSTQSASSTDSATFSSTVCQKFASCDAKSDVQTCQAKIDDESLKRLRSDFTSAAASCISNKSCAEINGDAINDCFAEANVDITPTDATKSFCHAVVSSFAHCDYDELDYAKCLSAYKQYSDTEAQKLEACTTKSCSTMVECINAETK